MTKNRKDSIELSIKSKNLNADQNNAFSEVKAIRYADLENTLKSTNFSAIQWRGNIRKTENFISATGFVIDIDNGMIIDEALAVLNQNRLNYALVTSKSHSDTLHKFHILLPFNRKIFTKENYKAAAERIKDELFPSLDTNTLDAARYIFGSPESAIYYSNFLNYAFEVDKAHTVSDAWNDDFEVTLSDSSIVPAVNQKFDGKTTIPIYCPFHDDTAPSAFLAYSDQSFNHFIHCKSCAKTYWKIQTKDIMALKSENFWSYNTSVYEAGLTGDVFSLENISEKKFYVKVGAITKEQKEVYFSYLVKNKHLHRLNRIDSIGDIHAEKSKFDVNMAEGSIMVRVQALPVNKEDNAFIENYLTSVFGPNTKFIKEWLAMYVYSNYAKLPTIILTGDRGVGKNTFAEVVAAIYPSLSETAKDLDANFNPFAEKKLLIIDESASNGKVQYQMLKKFSGQKMIEVNKKYIPQYQVRNNLNIIFLSNDELPIYVERDEIPTDERNNQFFVYRLQQHGKFDANLQEKLIQRMGYYIRTELKTVFDNLNTEGYRYSIVVPITEAEKKLFNNSVTDIESEADRVIDYIESNINSSTWQYSDFVQTGHLPSILFQDHITNHRVNKTKVIQNLQKRGYIANDKADKYVQVKGQRPYCYKLGQVWLNLIKQQTQKVPAPMFPDRHPDPLTDTKG